MTALLCTRGQKEGLQNRQKLRPCLHLITESSFKSNGFPLPISEEEFQKALAYDRITIFDPAWIWEKCNGNYDAMVKRIERIIFHEKLHDASIITKTNFRGATSSFRDLITYCLL